MKCNCLEGKLAVVTGAGGRLGQRLAARFIKEGAQVITLGKGGAETFTLDLTNESGVIDVFQRIWRENERMDILVHAVGMWAEWPFLDTDMEDWERMMLVNLTSSFLCFREAARYMVDTGGTLIGIGARSGLETATAKGGAYAASKAGLVRLVEAIAAEHPTLNTYAIAPSTIRYRRATGPGVHADDLVQMAVQLCCMSPGVLRGTVLQAYGNHAHERT